MKVVQQVLTLIVTIGFILLSEYSIYGATLCRSCLDAKTQGLTNINGNTGDGIYVMDPDGAGSIQPFNVYCDMTTDGGGWTLIAWDPVTYENDPNGHTNIDFDHDINQIGDPTNYHPTLLNKNTYYIGSTNFAHLICGSTETRILVANNDDDNDPRVYDMVWNHAFTRKYDQDHGQPDRIITIGTSYYPKQTENPGDLWEYNQGSYITFGNLAIFYHSKPQEIGGNHWVRYENFPTLDWDNMNDNSGWDNNPQDNSDIQAAFVVFLRGVEPVGLCSEPNGVDWWYVQNRKRENGTTFNTANFAILDQNGDYVLEDVVQPDSIELFDPSDEKITFDSASYGGTYWTMSGSYDTNIGRWFFDNSLHLESYYNITFQGTLTPGQYRLTLTDNNGKHYDLNREFNGLAEVPLIPSSSFCANFINGDLFWKWKIPSDMFSDVNTSVRATVTAYGKNDTPESEIYITVPTHMGWAFAPSNLLDLIKEKSGNNLKIGLHVRSNDNNNRAYSDKIPVEEANACASDINGDQRVGLEEAINVLQILSGVK